MNIYKYDVIMVSTQEINDNRPNIVLNKKVLNETMMVISDIM
jgi:hypothetical protein